MKKTGFLMVFLSVLLSGCATLQTATPTATPEAAVQIGMAREKVATLMSHAVTVGVEIDPVTGATKPVEAPSLYSTEFVVHKNISYLVDFYILGVDATSVRSPGEETLPFIFENNILVGKGHDALKALQEK